MTSMTPIAVRASLMKERGLSAKDALTLMQEFPTLEGAELHQKCVEALEIRAQEKAQREEVFAMEESFHNDIVDKLNAKIADSKVVSELTFEYERIHGFPYILIHSNVDEQSPHSYRFHHFGSILRLIEEAKASGERLSVEVISERIKKDSPAGLSD